MKILDKRKQEILQFLESENVLQVNELSERLNVTPQTIRKDIKELDEQGLIKRFHGGITLLGNTLNDSYAERKLTTYWGNKKLGKLLPK